MRLAFLQIGYVFAGIAGLLFLCSAYLYAQEERVVSAANGLHEGAMWATIISLVCIAMSGVLS